MDRNKEMNVLYHDLEKTYQTMTRGKGAYVFDAQGKKYLDAIGGVGVVNIGHGVEEVIEAITQQARTLAFSDSGLVDNLPQQELAFML